MQPPEDLAGQPLRRITREEYERLISIGFFAEDEKVELLYGKLVPMSPQGDRHRLCILRLTTRLVRAVGERAHVACQLPIHAPHDSMPEPDFALLPPGSDENPRWDRAFLIIEIADSFLRVDRGVKAALYADAAIPEYWIVNLANDTIEVLRQPADGRYGQLMTYRPGEAISIEAFPDITLAVDQILPPK